jgi:hypothetical protein
LSDFEDLEKLVATIQAELAPTAEVLHNQRLPSLLSGHTRQVDVLVKDRILNRCLTQRNAVENLGMGWTNTGNRAKSGTILYPTFLMDSDP